MAISQSFPLETLLSTACQHDHTIAGTGSDYDLNPFDVKKILEKFHSKIYSTLCRNILSITIADDAKNNVVK